MPLLVTNLALPTGTTLFCQTTRCAAVNESMLLRQLLSYGLAQVPVADTTILAGLLIRELLMQADPSRYSWPWLRPSYPKWGQIEL